mmetsp:Transcript_24695/g.78883  ORF Transcript_24695/g.78883 Transcript_24695/m.78883 type:complete len:169 (+) Transcript_24695:79-585(+)
MDKSALLDILRLNSANEALGRECGWVGSCELRPPPPFGRTQPAAAKVFNQRMLEAQLGPQGHVRPRMPAPAARSKRATVVSRGSSVASRRSFSPLQAYEEHLAHDYGVLARALASGNASLLPGSTIGERSSGVRRHGCHHPSFEMQATAATSEADSSTRRQEHISSTR